jgi:hypothetical protein
VHKIKHDGYRMIVSPMCRNWHPAERVGLSLGSRFSNFRFCDPETGSTMGRDRFEGEIGA